MRLQEYVDPPTVGAVQQVLDRLNQETIVTVGLQAAEDLIATGRAAITLCPGDATRYRMFIMKDNAGAFILSSNFGFARELPWPGEMDATYFGEKYVANPYRNVATVAPMWACVNVVEKRVRGANV